MATGPEPVGPAPILTGKIRVDWGRVRIGFSPIAKFEFGVRDGILNTHPEPVLEPAPLIINIYYTLKYETIRLNFMLMLN